MAPETAVQRSRDVLLAVPAIPEVETLAFESLAPQRLGRSRSMGQKKREGMKGSPAP